MHYTADAQPQTLREDDVSWPRKNVVGKQELEVKIDKEHISFEVCPYFLKVFSYSLLIGNSMQTAKIGALAEVNDSSDPDGLRVFYYLIQDLKVSIVERRL